MDEGEDIAEMERDVRDMQRLLDELQRLGVADDRLDAHQRRVLRASGEQHAAEAGGEHRLHEHRDAPHPATPQLLVRDDAGAEARGPDPHDGGGQPGRRHVEDRLELPGE